MKFVIFKRNGEEIGEKINSYESSFKDDTSNNRSEDQAEPKAIHLELPQDLDEDCVTPVWMEIQSEQVVTLREPTEEQEGIYYTVPAIQGWGLVEDADNKMAKRQAKANANLDAIRFLREKLLVDADHSINRSEDDVDAPKNNSLRAWRIALRECTDTLKKVNGDAKLICENMVADEFVFPAKPE